MIFNHYLVVRFWDELFKPSNHEIETTRASVRFPEQNMLYYSESLLMTIASKIGTPVKVDKNNLEASRGRFARVCIKIVFKKTFRMLSAQSAVAMDTLTKTATGPTRHPQPLVNHVDQAGSARDEEFTDAGNQNIHYKFQGDIHGD
ncbi:hypothetical protein L6164_008668 [Bauhinia variegata]|uniref:Uncharacterized protein n=1 Tax=Bauhinia variegata TaxID=167791 RepID=A0ACB9PGG3_BAUVA|nr:hypothetical protein L6164_008668 [Bauhinia variegata]